MKLRTILAAATCLALPIAAHAQPVTGPYVNLGGGLSLEPNSNWHSKQVPVSGKFLWRPGYTVMTGVGYGFGNGFRVELDGDYVHTTVHKADISHGPKLRVSGAERNYGGFINGYYDASLGWPIFPFVGVGVGYHFVSLDPRISGKGLPQVYGDKGSVAYDVIAGMSYPLAAVPGLSFNIEYRLLGIPQSRSYIVSKGYGRLKIGSEFSHSVMLGVRYQLFNPPPPAPAPAPAPAPVAAPAPAPAKTYLVFFDWDKYNLTPRAMTIISQAAADSKTQQVTTIAVNGYTDTSGTPTYNMGLSWRRAKAVAAQLVSDGVPASEIQAQGFGETHLLVPTGPGVREPQNRRVEIVMQ